jgi:hypothetical protein
MAMTQWFSLKTCDAIRLRRYKRLSTKLYGGTLQENVIATCADVRQALSKERLSDVCIDTALGSQTLQANVPGS